MSKHIPKGVRKQVAERANDCCEYCFSRALISSTSFSIEHIFPLIKGGTNDLNNLAYSCQGCNNLKFTFISGLDPLLDREAPLYNPRKDGWSDHFQWSEDKQFIIGLTSTGRATIDRLKLNRPRLVKQRAILLKVGEHPTDNLPERD